MNKEQTVVEWLKDALETSILTNEQIMQVIGLFEQAKEMEIKQAVNLLTKYHNRMFFIPFKEGEAERIYNYIKTMENE